MGGDDLQQATAGGRTLPRAPHFAACCQAGRRREASSGLSFGVNAGLKFLKIAGLKFPGSDVRFGR